MEGENWIDDGNETLYQHRLAEWMRMRWQNKIEKKKENGGKPIKEKIDNLTIKIYRSSRRRNGGCREGR